MNLPHSDLHVPQGRTLCPFRTPREAGGGQVGLDDGEVGEAVQRAPAAAGGAHLHLGWADVAFGLVGRLRVMRRPGSIRTRCFAPPQAGPAGARQGGDRSRTTLT